MINIFEVKETNNMVEHENLDVRTITIGISLLSCIDSDLKKLNENIYNRITSVAKDLAKVAGEIEAEYGIPIVNKRISVTPIALIGGAACKTPEDFATIADTMDRAAEAIGADLIGGYSALVSKGMTKADEMLIRSIPIALCRNCRDLGVDQSHMMYRLNHITGSRFPFGTDHRCTLSDSSECLS